MNAYNEASVQLTLKPILSFRHAIDDKKRGRLLEKDERSNLIKKIHAEFDNQGLNHLVARPGGRSSIDITLEKLDKAYALEYLIDITAVRVII